MSNTTTVSPYENDTTTADVAGFTTATSDVVGAVGSAVGATVGMAGAAVGASIVGAASIMMEETEEGREAVERLKKDRRREALQAAKPTELGLHITDRGSLVRAAEKLGYRPEKISKTIMKVDKKSSIVMYNDSGKQLILAATTGGVAVSSPQGIQPINALVRQHTIAAAKQHLALKYKDVTAKVAQNGVLEIQAKERDTRKSGGTAQVKALVSVDGQVEIDVSCIKGSRCEEIVKDFADAVGAKATTIKKKEVFWQLPGESTKTKVKI